MPSAVLSQMEAWAEDKSAPPGILVAKRPAVDLRRRVYSLLHTSEPTQLSQLRKLATKARSRVDLTRSASYSWLVFGGASAGPGGKGMRPPRGRPSAQSGKRMSGKRMVEFDDSAIEVVKSVSRVGRAVKTPNKFKETHSPRSKASRMFLQQTSPRSSASGSASRARASGGANRGPGRPRGSGDLYGGIAEEDEEMGDAPPQVFDTGSRVGDAYQATVPPMHADGADQASASADRGDLLMWSPTSGMGDVASYIERALPLLGGAPQYPPTIAAAHELFPPELAFIALHRAGGDAEAALEQLRKGGAAGGLGGLARDADGLREWSKVEERHFRSAFTKHRFNILAMHEAVRTKSLKAVIRFYYVEDGVRIKTERERKRELEMLKQARSAAHAPKDSNLQPKTERPGSTPVDEALSRASTPFEAADPMPMAEELSDD